MHDPWMLGRFLAVCGWLAWQVSRRLGAIAFRRRMTNRNAATAAGAALLLVALMPLVVPNFDAQPEGVTVQQVIDGAIAPGTWVRLAGTTVALEDSPTGVEGSYAILADRVNPLRSIVVQGDVRTAIESPSNVTGRVTEATVLVDAETLPIEATVAGTPPTIATNHILNLDAAPKAFRASLWPLSLLPAILGGMVLIGARVGYPIFRETFEIDVLSSPLGPGERLPSAFGGRVGPNERDLGDPGAALLLVRRGPKGNVLTAQPLNDAGGPPPAAVAIGGGWTSGRTGYVHTITESVPALTIKSEEVDATFLFASPRERDRVAALVAVGH
jgi:hypothetical protein